MSTLYVVMKVRPWSNIEIDGLPLDVRADPTLLGDGFLTVFKDGKKALDTFPDAEIVKVRTVEEGA